MAVPASPRPSTSFSRTAWAISALADVRKQRQLARTLHRQRQLLLVLAGEAGDSAGPGLATVRDEAAGQGEGLVVDRLDVEPRVLPRPPAIAQSAASTATRRGLLSLLSRHEGARMVATAMERRSQERDVVVRAAARADGRALEVRGVGRNVRLRLEPVAAASALVVRARAEELDAVGDDLDRLALGA